MFTTRVTMVTSSLNPPWDKSVLLIRNVMGEITQLLINRRTAMGNVAEQS